MSRRAVNPFIIMALAVLIPGCRSVPIHSTGPAQAAYQSPVSVEILLKENIPASGVDVKSVEVYRTAGSSYHLVQIVTQEKPHRHDHHDLAGYIVKGQGTLHHGGLPHPVAAGSVFYIPHGAVHYFVNSSTEPSAAWVSFTPPFDGQDNVPADLPQP